MRARLITAMSELQVAIERLALAREKHITESKISPAGEDLLFELAKNLGNVSQLVADDAKADGGSPPTTFQITGLQIYPVRGPQGKLRAYARVMLGDQLQLTALRVYDGSGGLFVSYPSDPSYKGEDYRQLFYPVTRELRDEIEKAVLAEYYIVTSERKEA